MQQSGNLHIIIGCMFAGKTTRLIETYNKYKNAGKNVCVITHSIDERYSVNHVCNHNNEKIPCIKMSSITDIGNIPNLNLNNLDALLIDEGQFFNDLDLIVSLVDEKPIDIFVFGLDGDFKRKKFGKILDLIPMSTTVEKLQALCNNCNNKAHFSHRIINSDKQIDVGANDKYVPLCRTCYLKQN
jgi:thymidine kinase